MNLFVPAKEETENVKTFRVRQVDTMVLEIEIEAKNSDEAIKIFNDMKNDGEIDFSEEELCDTEILVEEAD